MTEGILYAGLFLLGILLSIIGYLIIRLLNQIDKGNDKQDKLIDQHGAELSKLNERTALIAKHDSTLVEHADSLSKVWAAVKTLESTNKSELKNISEKLERVLDELERNGKAWQDLFEKYDIKEK